MPDEIRLLRELASEPLGPTAAERHQAEQRLLAAIDRESRRPSRIRLRKHRTILVTVTAALASIALVVIAAVFATDSPPGKSHDPQQTIVVKLNRFASLAADQPPTVVPPAGQYLYSKSQQTDIVTVAITPQQSYSLLVPETVQSWINATGSGHIQVSVGAPAFLTVQDHANWIDAGSPTLARVVPPSYSREVTTSGPKLTRASTTPRILATQIVNRQLEGGPPGIAETFTQIGDLLRSPNASPDLRAALFKVAATLSGVTISETTTDHAGHRGIGIAFTDHGIQKEYIFDQTSTQLLGEKTIVTSATNPYQARPGTTIGSDTYQQSGVVVASPTTPPTTS